MKRINKAILYLVIFITFTLVSTIPVQAGSEATCIFLLIEPGSRPGGMGHSYVSIADGGIASWWNPGGLAFIKGSDLALMHSNWFADVVPDMYYEYLGYVQHLERIGTLGLNITYMTYGEQQAYDALGNPLQKFTSYEIAVGGAYGTQIRNNLGLGINLKGVISGLCPYIKNVTSGEGTGYTFVVDLGVLKKGVDVGQMIVSPYNGILALYNGFAYLIGTNKMSYSKFSIPIERLNFGANLQNFGPDISYANSENHQPMPLNFRSGFSYKVLDSEYNKMIVSADINKMLVNWDPLWKRWFTSIHDDPLKDEIESTIENIGIEYKYYNLISLRTGYVNDVAGHITGVSFGGGISYEFSKGKELSFDFALQPAGELTPNNKTFSLGVKF